VLVALLLWPVVLASFGGVLMLITATVMRGRLSAVKGHIAECREMCAGTFSPKAAARADATGCGCRDAVEGR
jgi:hypothetical protein